MAVMMAIVEEWGQVGSRVGVSLLGSLKRRVRRL